LSFKHQIVIFTAKFLTMKNPKLCESINEIRFEIDQLDRQILVLFAQRMEYVQEIVKFKSDPDGIVARDRQLEVFKQRKEWATELGLDPDLFGDFFEKLVSRNVAKEMEMFNNHDNI